MTKDYPYSCLFSVCPHQHPLKLVLKKNPTMIHKIWARGSQDDLYIQVEGGFLFSGGHQPETLG